MRLIFDGTTFGGVAYQYGLTDLDGLDAPLENISQQVSRTDSSRNIADYLRARIVTAVGMLTSNDPNEFRTIKRTLANKVRNTYTFTLQDMYRHNGTYNLFATYEFSGKITKLDPEINAKVASSNYLLEITCEDPLIYAGTSVTASTPVQAPGGLSFPLHFPLQWVDPTVGQIIVTNSGDASVYPEWTLTGGGSGWVITNMSTTLSNADFLYNANIATSDYITINPSPSDPIKVRDSSGNSVVGNSNSNFNALIIPPGTVTFNIIAQMTDANSEASLSFRSAYIGI